jgi:hypothetical protein
MHVLNPKIAAVAAAAVPLALGRELSHLQTQIARAADAGTTYSKNVSSCPGTSRVRTPYRAR